MDRYYREIEPWKHYVPVKSDLSDLVELIQWARNNDSEARQISLNAQAYIQTQDYRHVHQEFASQLQQLFAVER